jgi:hypothetical protein
MRSVLAVVLLSACGAAPPQASEEAPLPCAGQVLVTERPIPELGPLPSGDPVTAGISLACEADHLQALDWGPDSSASYTFPREHAMERWRAFEQATTEEERRRIVGEAE